MNVENIMNSKEDFKENVNYMATDTQLVAEIFVTCRGPGECNTQDILKGREAGENNK